MWKKKIKRKNKENSNKKPKWSHTCQCANCCYVAACNIHLHQQQIQLQQTNETKTKQKTLAKKLLLAIYGNAINYFLTVLSFWNAIVIVFVLHPTRGHVARWLQLLLLQQRKSGPIARMVAVGWGKSYKHRLCFGSRVAILVLFVLFLSLLSCCYRR